MIKNTVFLIVLFCCLNYNLIAQIQEPTYDGIINEYFTNEAPGATVLVTKNGEIIFKKSIGIKDIKANERIESDDVFRIASITKQFTAVAILKLVEEGKLNGSSSFKVGIEF